MYKSLSITTALLAVTTSSAFAAGCVWEGKVYSPGSKRNEHCSLRRADGGCRKNEFDRCNATGMWSHFVENRPK